MGSVMTRMTSSPNRHIFVYQSMLDSKRPMRLGALANMLADKVSEHSIKPVVRSVGGGVLFDFHKEYFIAYGVTADDVRQSYGK